MISELEGAVLGLIARRQPMTAYAVRRTFADSPTHGWSASAGAIYPLVERLVASGLVTRAQVTGDARGSRVLEISPKGMQALVEWIGSSRADIFSPVPDPLRTRAYAIELLPPEKRHERLHYWHDETTRQIAALERLIEPAQGTERRSLRGVALQLHARREWIGEWLADLAENSDG